MHQAPNLVVLILGLAWLVGGAAARAENQKSQFEMAHSEYLKLLEPEQPDISLGYGLEPIRTDNNSPASFFLNRINLLGNAEAPLTPDLYLYYGAEFQSQIFHFRNVQFEHNKNLFYASPSLGLGWFASDKLLLQGEFTPQITTDLVGGIDRGAIQMQGAASASLKVWDQLILSLGIAAENNPTSYPVVPSIGLAWRSMNERVTAHISAPEEAELSYFNSPSTEFYIGYWFDGNDYSVKFKQSPGRAKLSLEDSRLGAGVSYKVNQLFLVGIEVGSCVKSSINIARAPIESIGTVDPGLYLELHAGFSFS
jgi:hypothetical protein